MKCLLNSEITAIEKAGINITNLTPCEDGQRGAIWICLQTETTKLNLSFDGAVSAIGSLYKQCMTNRNVILYGIH